MTVKTVVAEFVDRIASLIESQSLARTRAVVLSAFGGPPRRGPGRPPKLEIPKATAPIARKKRKKAPLQLCPVPGCKNPAAPIFGMVCAKHKNLPKAKIKKYREARRAKKLGLPPPKVRRRRVVKQARPRKVSKTPAKVTTAPAAMPPAPAPS
jgi:hypothetical protein